MTIDLALKTIILLNEDYFWLSTNRPRAVFVGRLRHFHNYFSVKWNGEYSLNHPWKIPLAPRIFAAYRSPDSNKFLIYEMGWQMGGAYEEILNRVVDVTLETHGSSTSDRLRQMIYELEDTDTTMGALMFGLDTDNFDMILGLLVEFRNTGRYERFNAMHRAARGKISNFEEASRYEVQE